MIITNIITPEFFVYYVFIIAFFLFFLFFIFYFLKKLNFFLLPALEKFLLVSSTESTDWSNT
jgi:hypothetical protein